ncbi:NAD(P)H-dependent oxidoreductase [Lutimaribacter marinistellae]|uniref:NAD(P)H-dependent oxidoreductase n=1 Tax=Lutimaribacter marinistellae TaxID=1820329 RepID=A0ABV7TF87_9RHOB
MNILIVQGHPDHSEPHLCHALAEAYAEGAREGGHELRRITVADLPITFLRSARDYAEGEPPYYAKEAQEAVMWADHMMVVFPLWVGGMPALLRAWFEQSFREGFVMEIRDGRVLRHLKGKSARLVVTMGMPSLFYRWYFGQPGTKLLRRSVLGFAGVRPVRQTLIGMVDKLTPAKAEKLFSHMRDLGRKAS